MMRNLESCSGNDALMSESDMRRTSRTLPIVLAGSDFMFSGFGSIQRYDNMFGPSNFNAEDIDDFLAMQRDWGIDGGLRTVHRGPDRGGAPGGRAGVPRRLPAPRPCRLHRRPPRAGRGRGRLEGPRRDRHAGRGQRRAGDPGRRDHRRRRRRRARRDRVRGRGRADPGHDPRTGLPETTCRPLPSSTSRCGSSRWSPTRTTTPGPGTGYEPSPSARREIDAIRQAARGRGPAGGAGSLRRCRFWR